MCPVNCQVISGTAHRFVRCLEDVDKTHLLVLGNLADYIGVHFDSLVVQVGRGHAFDVLVGDWRDEHNLRSTLAVERFRLGVFDESGK